MPSLVDKLKDSLFKDTELRARQIYEFILEQPKDVRKYLKGLLQDTPIYAEEEENKGPSSYREELATLDEQD